MSCHGQQHRCCCCCMRRYRRRHFYYMYCESVVLLLLPHRGLYDVLDYRLSMPYPVYSHSIWHLNSIYFNKIQSNIDLEILLLMCAGVRSRISGNLSIETHWLNAVLGRHVFCCSQQEPTCIMASRRYYCISPTFSQGQNGCCRTCISWQHLNQYTKSIWPITSWLLIARYIATCLHIEWLFKSYRMEAIL